VWTTSKLIGKHNIVPVNLGGSRRIPLVDWDALPAPRHQYSGSPVFFVEKKKTHE
jgi:hypothetical protein